MIFLNFKIADGRYIVNRFWL